MLEINKQSSKKSEETTNSDKDASTSNHENDANKIVNQDYGDFSKLMDCRTKSGHDVQTGENESDSSEEEDPLDDAEQKLKLLYADTGFSFSDYNNLDDWIDHDSFKDSSFLAGIEATGSKLEQDILADLSKNVYSKSHADSLLQYNQEQTDKLKRKYEEGTRRNEVFDARLAKFKYLRAVRLCEDGAYERAAEKAEEAGERSPGNEMVKELKRKITILRIGVLEDEIKELRKSWWKDRKYYPGRPFFALP